MADRSSRPHRSPRRTPTRTERRIIKVRVLRRWGPARIAHLLHLVPSTVHRVLTRYGLARLSHLDRATGRVIRRYERDPRRLSVPLCRRFITSDEALVLSDWLERVQMTDLSRLVDDPAAWAPIHKLAGTLEKALPGIFAADCAERLDAARRRLRDAMGSFTEEQDS